MEPNNLANKSSNFSFLIHSLLFIIIFIMGGSLVLLYKQVSDLSARQVQTQIIEKTQTVNTTTPVDDQYIKNLVSQTLTSLLPTPTATPQKVTNITTTTIKTTSSPRTSYIPMGSTTTTTATDWVDVPDSATYIDLKNDFGANAYVTFEANLKVANANGQAYVRLYDATNNISVNDSELSTVNNDNFQQVVSSKLNLWNGKNLYKVQIKSLNGLEITYSGGKIKITY
jgi:hypothetical protein